MLKTMGFLAKVLLQVQLTQQNGISMIKFDMDMQWAMSSVPPEFWINGELRIVGKLSKRNTRKHCIEISL